MDNLKKFFDQFKDGLLERFSNPLVSSFLISWAIINYRVILTVFGQLHKDGNWLDKINYIDLVVWAGTNFYLYAFIYPLISAILWVYCFSGLLRKITLWERKRLNLLRKHALRIDREKVITRSEDIALRKHIREEWIKISEEAERNSKALQNLVASNSKLQISLNTVNEEKDIFKGEVDKITDSNNKLTLDLMERDKRISEYLGIINPPDLYFNPSGNYEKQKIDDLLISLGFLYASREYFSHASLFNKEKNYKFPIVTKTKLINSKSRFQILDKDYIITNEFVILILCIHKYISKENLFGKKDENYLSCRKIIELCKDLNIDELDAINNIREYGVLDIIDFNKFVKHEAEALIQPKLYMLAQLFLKAGFSID